MCEYCEGNELLLNAEKSGHQIMVALVNNEICIAAEVEVSFKANNCPMCGQKLEVQEVEP